MQAVVSGAVTLQRHLAAAGLVDSPACPFCDSGEAETEKHASWQCPAWAHIRRKHMGADQIDLSEFPKITQSCAVVTRSVQDQQLSARFLDVSPLSGPLPPTDGQQDDTYSYGRRVGVYRRLMHGHEEGACGAESRVRVGMGQGPPSQPGRTASRPLAIFPEGRIDGRGADDAG